MVKYNHINTFLLDLCEKCKYMNVATDECKDDEMRESSVELTKTQGRRGGNRSMSPLWRLADKTMTTMSCFLTKEQKHFKQNNHLK